MNEAYKTLNSDSLRGEYLLGKRGIQIEEKDKMEDPGLLMEILEVREALADAQTEEQVADIREQNKRRWFHPLPFANIFSPSSPSDIF